MPHIDDAELLQFADDELPLGRAAEVRAHVENCWQCFARQGELHSGLANFVEARAAALNGQVPAVDVAAARLRARLSAHLVDAPAAAMPARSQWALPAAALVAAMAIGGFWWLQWQTSQAMKPDARLTPGATLSLSRDEVCAVPDADDVRIVPASLAGQVFTSYGIRPTPRSYEVDYLIAPALGGATDVRNLWPQPYGGGVWNARVKDALEDHLRHLVCEGRVDLPVAQHEIASDWIAAYRKYFQTDQPLAAHTTYLKDRPWE
jgi:hypothetical protein